MTFDIDHARADRSLVGIVAVDAGCVAIRAAYDNTSSSVFYPEFDAAQGWSCSSPSGFGDGGYEVFELVRSGTTVGVEVVFIDHVAEDETAAALEAAGFSAPPVYPEYDCSETGVDDRLVRDERYNTWAVRDALYNTIAHETFTASLVRRAVDERSRPVVLGLIEHTGGMVEVTDPYCGSTGPSLALPAGAYHAVRWDSSHPSSRHRPARLGVYLAPTVSPTA